MVGETESRDRREARTVLAVLLILGVALAVGGALALPLLIEFGRTHLEPGVGVKDAALIAFIASMVTLVVFAIAAGDGLIGEIQFMLAGFFAFFLTLWLLIAWVF